VQSQKLNNVTWEAGPPMQWIERKMVKRLRARLRIRNSKKKTLLEKTVERLGIKSRSEGILNFEYVDFVRKIRSRILLLELRGGF
jgi:hypothetical protein